MTTRGRIARGEHQQDFEGHVQRWVKQWEQVGGTSKMKVLKWVPTGDRSESKAESRFPHLKPVRDSSLKVVFRPKQQPPSEAQQPPKTTEQEDLANGLSVAEAMQLDKKGPAPLVQADVPMSEARAVGEEVPQGIGPEQLSVHAASGEAHGTAAQKQQQESSAGVQKHGGPATDAQSPDRAVAEQAAQETLAALNADSAAKQATHSAQAAAPTAGGTAVSRDAEANAAAGSAIAIAGRAVVQQGHAPAGASAGAAPESAKPGGPAAAMEAIEATAKQLGGPVDSTNDQAMPDAEAQP